MNKTRQLIVVAIVLVSIIAIASLSFVGSNNTNNTGVETAETEEGLPVHDIIYSPPITDVKGPFTIEYLYTKNHVDYIKITDSSPQGRMNAMHWLRERGIDPTELNIKFDDFKNPLISENN